MKVTIGKREIHFLWVFGMLIFISALVVTALLYMFNIPYMKILFGGFALLLVIVLAYYWMNSKGYYNNLGRIRRTFYTMYLLFMIYGFISENIDYKDWQLLIQFSILAIFVDLAVFQNPNILKIWNTELKHEDEVREALSESKKVILKNAKKVEKFSEVIQYTDLHFNERPIPINMKEYKEQLREYLELYSNTLGFTISFFIFNSPTNEEQKMDSIKSQINNISIRHAIEFSNIQEDKDAMQNSFSIGETLILKEGELIAIPYFGDFFSMIATIESKDGLVDGIDASHILSMLVIFDWYMTDSETAEYDVDEITLIHESDPEFERAEKIEV